MASVAEQVRRLAQEQIDYMERIHTGVKDRAACLGRIEQPMSRRSTKGESEIGRNMADLTKIT